MALVGKQMRAIIISDTHEQHEKIVLPEGDLLIHCGDMTKQGSIGAVGKAITWMKAQPFAHKIAIAGNHDNAFQNANQNIARKMMQEAGITYLQDSWTEIDG